MPEYEFRVTRTDEFKIIVTAKNAKEAVEDKLEEMKGILEEGFTATTTHIPEIDSEKAKQTGIDFDSQWEDGEWEFDWSFDDDE